MTIALAILGYLALGVATLGVASWVAPDIYLRQRADGIWYRPEHFEGIDYLFTILLWPIGLPVALGWGVVERNRGRLNQRVVARRQLEMDLAAARREIDTLLSASR